MSSEFDRDRFASVVGTVFTLRAAESKSAEIELVEVSPLKERPQQVTFSLLFLAPENSTFEQGLYELEHPDLGPLQIFLVPVGTINNRFQLEAVFNSLREEPAEPTKSDG